MLSDRERRVLAGIEHRLADSAPGLDRRMRIHAWRSTPRQRAPRLPLVLLIIGVAGGLPATMFASSISIPVAFLVGFLAFALILYGLFTFQ